MALGKEGAASRLRRAAAGGGGCASNPQAAAGPTGATGPAPGLAPGVSIPPARGGRRRRLGCCGGAASGGVGGAARSPLQRIEASPAAGGGALPLPHTNSLLCRRPPAPPKAAGARRGPVGLVRGGPVQARVFDVDAEGVGQPTKAAPGCGLRLGARVWAAPKAQGCGSPCPERGARRAGCGPAPLGCGPAPGRSPGESTIEPLRLAPPASASG